MIVVGARSPAPPDPMLRTALLFLSRQNWLRRWVENSSAAQPLTRRFIAGLTLEDELAACARLKAEGITATLDHLGENVSSVEESHASRDSYIAALDGIARMGLPATVSVKPTQLGLDLGEDVCLANCGAIARRAKEFGSCVEIDMEASEYADRTLSIVRRVCEQYGCVRAVVQAYLYRTAADIEDLNERGIPVRLVKGAYREPATVAYPKKADVDASFVRLMERLLDNGRYPAIATHDEAIIASTLEHVRRRGYPADRFEFQMLFGIRRDLQRKLTDEGYRLRLYVPYGDAWYPYFMRRLAERPANLLFMARNLARK
jgi:proline dehydrogenase